MVAIFLIIILVMRVLQSTFSKKVSMNIPAGIKPYIKYIGISKLLAAGFALITIIMEGGFGNANLEMLIISACSGIALAIGSLCGIKALQNGTLALSSMFSTAGLLVPCVLGIFVFDEPLSVMQMVCIAALLIGAWLLVDSSKKLYTDFSLKSGLYLTGSLLTNGIVMFCQKLFGELQPDGNVALFSMLTFLIPAAVLLCAIPFVGEKGKGENKLPKSVILYSVVLAFAVFIIQQFVTILTTKLSSAVLFTFVNGGATVVAAIVGAILYKEKITLKSALGVIIGVTAMICIKIF